MPGHISVATFSSGRRMAGAGAMGVKDFLARGVSEGGSGHRSTYCTVTFGSAKMAINAVWISSDE